MSDPKVVAQKTKCRYCGTENGIIVQGEGFNEPEAYAHGPQPGHVAVCHCGGISVFTSSMERRFPSPEEFVSMMYQDPQFMAAAYQVMERAWEAGS